MVLKSPPKFCPAFKRGIQELHLYILLEITIPFRPRTGDLIIGNRVETGFSDVLRLDECPIKHRTYIKKNNSIPQEGCTAGPAGFEPTTKSLTAITVN